MDFFNNLYSNQPQTQGQQNNPKMAQRYQIGQYELQDEVLMSEGGYGYVWKAYDVRTQKIYAVKKMICQNDEKLNVAKNEMDIMKKLKSIPNIVNYLDGQIYKTDNGYTAILILEFCQGGSLFDLMMKYEKSKLNEKQIVFIINEICQGLKQMHDKKIAHRDLKIENVLLENKRFKLCDFGSSSEEQIDFSQIQRGQYYIYEEVFEKNTTLMYRPPEMCDLYQQFKVDEKVDIWMLGCVVYTLCFFKHPFQDSSKLGIVNASYIVPQNHSYSEKLMDLMRNMLTPNPKFRPSVYDLLSILSNYDNISQMQLNKQAQSIKNKMESNQNELKQFDKNYKDFDVDQDIPLDQLQKIKISIDNNDVHNKLKKLNNFQSKKINDTNLSQNQQKKKSSNNDFLNFGDFQSTNDIPNNEIWGSFQQPISGQSFDIIDQDQQNKSNKNDLDLIDFQQNSMQSQVNKKQSFDLI